MNVHPISDAALQQHLAVLGTSGYGKSNAIKGAIERLLERGERVVIVDPTGVWWGLRLTADGKRASPYPLVIFGGHHADLPLEEQAGEHLATVLGGSTTPAILDFFGMKVAARTRFFTAFAEALPSANRSPLHLVIDEAHLFAPQSGGTGLLPALVHATNNLVALGRSAGLSIVLITQRAAKLHKDALSQATALVVMGLIDARDRAAAKGWLDGAPDQTRAKEIMASLASLPIGTGWIYAPRDGVLERAAFPLVSTFDSGRPEANYDSPALKPIDVAALRQALAVDRPAESKPLQRDSDQGQVDENATRKLQQSAAEAATKREEIEAAERRGYERGQAEGLRRGVAAGWKAAATLMERDVAVLVSQFPATPDHEDAETEIASALGLAAWPKQTRSGEPKRLPSRSCIVEAEKPLSRRAEAVAQPEQSRAIQAPANNSAGLSPTAQRIVDVLEGAYPVSLTFKAAALRAGASPRSSQFRSYRREVEAAPEVEVIGDRLRARHGDPIKGGGDVLQAYAAKLQPSWAAMLETLAASSGPLARNDIADRASVSRTSSGLAAGLKELCAMELAVRELDGRYALNPDLRA